MYIKLRNLTLDDVGEMVQWEENQDPLYYDYNFPRYNKREQNIWYQSKTKYGKICLAILAESKLVGYISLRKINPIKKSAEMGIIIRPLYQNMGIGTMAISKMLDWYFNDFKYKKITLYVGKYNVKALACYESVGFRPVKELYLSFDNKMVDLENERYRDISKYFKKEKDKVLMQCYQMAAEKNDHNENASQQASDEK